VHALVIIAVAWAIAGWGRQLFIAEPWTNPASQRAAPLALGAVELTIVLGALDLLFLVFVALQLGYLFGGAAFVTGSAEFTVAEYARRGFFELVWVAAISLPLLLAMHWLARPGSRRAERGFAALTVCFVGLLFVIMASALVRMGLYTSLFGLTELRLYPTAFMGWLAIVFVWFIGTGLRGRRDRFAVGALVAGFVTVALLDVINPDGLIARTNLGRVGAPQPVDSEYLASLSADAVPALVTGLAALPPAEQQRVRTALATRWSATSPDWRTWNWSRSQAAAALATTQLVP